MKCWRNSANGSPTRAMPWCLAGWAFENTYAFAVTQETARTLCSSKRWMISPGSRPDFTMGTDVEFLNRPEWATIRDAYGFAFGGTQSYQPTFMYRAVESGRADVITAFSSDGRIAASNLFVLADPRGAVPNYDAVLLVAPDRVDDARFIAVLEPLIEVIDVETMREANYMVDRDDDKASPAEAARWIIETLALDGAASPETAD